MKKVLIITYYWPPSGGVGVQRWLKFVKYLSEFNWEPIIYTPRDPDFEILDESLNKDIPRHVKVIKRPIIEPFGIYRRILGKKAVQQQGVVGKSDSWLVRFSVWIRGNLFIPDARMFWIRPSVIFLTKYLKSNAVDAIVTTGPPHSMHLIGMELQRRSGVKWLADFRDPWSKWDVLDQLRLTKSSKKSHLKLEAEVLSRADLVLAVSKTQENMFKELGARRTSLITNGFDYDTNSISSKLPLKFRISHIGLLNRIRNPHNFWDALIELTDEIQDFKADLEIFLAGTIEKEVISSLEHLDKISSCIKNVGYITHDEVIDAYGDSALLLLLNNQTYTAEWILPGKMFEYIGTGRPILALGKVESDASEILKETGYQGCLSYHDKDAIKKFIAEQYKAFKHGQLPSYGGGAQKFQRRELTKSLAACLDEL